MPIGETDDLTEYEYEYEMLLQSEFHRYIQSIREPDNIDPNDGVSESEITMDPELYDSIRDRAERGEFIDFVLPDDSDAPRLSDRNKTKPESADDDFETVNPDDVFGKLFGGGSSG